MEITLHPDAPAWTRDALHILRDPTQFQWYVVALLAFVLYVYAVEIEKRNWNVILAGLAFWGMDWINEVINALWLHFTHYSAIWTTTGHTSYEILVGLNIEIAFLFSVAGIVIAKQLPEDRKLKVVGIPNRWLFVIGYSCFAVGVEILLHKTGYFGWTYPWWNFPNIWLIIPFGYGTFIVATVVVHDMRKRAHQLATVGAIWGVAVPSLVVFGALLHWI